MKKLSKILILIILIAILGGLFFSFSKRPKKITLELPKELPKVMKLESPAFAGNQSIPKKYTCDGKDINPPLKIEEVPTEAKSLVLIVDDPDAPFGTFTHWLVWNIDPKTTLIEENSVPEGAIQGLNDFGKNSYGGPCPPSGTHHYHFKLYAIDVLLDLPSSSKKSDLERAIKDHILDSAELIGTYQR